ncbi:MAG TPA: hypothetical protein VNC12_02945 [Solirubrobacteraceae bacterium]|nr:hypothetical protein [Solirubrobacteraceae bacterium]
MSSARWTLTSRAGSRVEREHLETLEAALDALARRLVALAPEASRQELQFMRRRIEPQRQVAARIEIAGPRGRRGTVRGGVDLRGDGSAEAFTGRVRRTVVECRRGESAADALRRVLAI